MDRGIECREIIATNVPAKPDQFHICPERENQHNSCLNCICRPWITGSRNLEASFPGIVLSAEFGIRVLPLLKQVVPS